MKKKGGSMKKKKTPPPLEYSPSELYNLYLYTKDNKGIHLRDLFFQSRSEPIGIDCVNILREFKNRLYKKAYRSYNEDFKYIEFYQKTYQALYEDPLEKMPLLINNENFLVRIITKWRLKLGR
jgi:hypothetical protein